MNFEQRKIIIKKLKLLVSLMGDKSYKVKSTHCKYANMGKCHHRCMNITIYNIETSDSLSSFYLEGELRVANEIWKQIKGKTND